MRAVLEHALGIELTNRVHGADSGCFRGPSARHRMSIPTRTTPLSHGAWVVACALAAVSCSPASKGALILAVSTDMQTPKDLDLISVLVSTNGALKFDYLGRVMPDGTLTLPSTLAIVEPDDPNAQVRVRVIAFQLQGAQQSARVLRD